MSTHSGNASARFCRDCSFPVLQQLFGKASLCLLYLDLQGRAAIPFLPHLLALLTGILGLEFSWGRPESLVSS